MPTLLPLLHRWLVLNDRVVLNRWLRHALLLGRRRILWLLRRLWLWLWLSLWLHHLQSVHAMCIRHHTIARRVVMHNMSTVSRMTNMSNWSDRKVMEDLLLTGMLVLVLVLMVVL